jgi:phage replication O-like protein O
MIGIAEPPATYQGDPQVEDGYTRIANELLEAITAAALSGAEVRVILAIIRKTYGFNKKADAISLGQLATATGSARRSVARVLQSLVDRRIVLRRAGAAYHASTWAINKHYQEWLEDGAQGVTSDETVTSDQSVTSDRIVTRSSDQPVTRSSDHLVTHKRQKDKKDMERIPSGQSAMMTALCDACQLDFGLHRSKLAAFAKRMVTAGYTAEQVGKCYGAAGWWVRVDWRGKQGQPPTLAQVESTIAQAVQARASPPVSSSPVQRLPDGSVMLPVAGPNARRT